MAKPYAAPLFLTELLHARSPSGYETEAQAVFDRHVGPAADAYAKDTMGNRIATVNPEGDPVLMLAGHMDELGLMITHVNKDGFLYFKPVGGHDRTIISGRRVVIQTARGPLKGVTGKRAVHLMTEEDRKKVPEVHDIWIDIGVASKKEALEKVSIGDVATYDHDFELFSGSIGSPGPSTTRSAPTCRGRSGLIRLAKEQKKLTGEGGRSRHGPGGDRLGGERRRQVLCGQSPLRHRGRRGPRDRPPRLRRSQARRDQAERRSHPLARSEF